MDIISKINHELNSHLEYNLYLIKMCEKVMPKEYTSDVMLYFYKGNFNQGRVYSDILAIDSSVMSYDQYKRNIKLNNLGIN